MIEMGALSALVLEMIKWVLRTWVLKDPLYDFSPKFYAIAVPVLNVLLIPFVGWLVPGSVAMPDSLNTFARMVVLVLVNSLISVLVYNMGIAPTKQAYRSYKAQKQYEKDYQARVNSVLQN